MVGIPVQCNGCPPDERCCQLDFDDDLLDDRTWQEWCGDVLFNPIMWTILASIAIGISGLCFFVGVWGFKSGLVLLSQM